MTREERREIFRSIFDKAADTMRLTALDDRQQAGDPAALHFPAFLQTVARQRAALSGPSRNPRGATVAPRAQARRLSVAVHPVEHAGVVGEQLQSLQQLQQKGRPAATSRDVVLGGDSSRDRWTRASAARPRNRASRLKSRGWTTALAYSCKRKNARSATDPGPEARSGWPTTARAVAGSKPRAEPMLITRSTFSTDAQAYVKGIEQRIVLVDGRTLAGYMFDFLVGTVPVGQPYVLKRVDLDFFEEA